MGNHGGEDWKSAMRIMTGNAGKGSVGMEHFLFIRLEIVQNEVKRVGQ